MRRWLKSVLPGPVVEAIRAWRADRRDAREWSAYRVHPVTPPPHVVKTRAVIEYGRRFGLGTLIETGTYEGEMARKCSPHFRRIVTIELDLALAREAERRLARLGNVDVLQGDSTRVLPDVLRTLHEPALFWLDGHFSGGKTARGESDTPLRAELEAIWRHPVPGHVILIDDARCLGEGDYPSVGEIRSGAALHQPGGEVVVAEDIVRCTPRPAAELARAAG